MQNMLAAIKDRIRQYNQLIWHSHRSDCSKCQWLAVRLVRTIVLAVQGFSRHHGSLRASALTFFSLLSLVPVAAMTFGIAKGFGFEKRLQQQLLENFSAQQEVVQQVIGFAQNLLDNTRGGMVAGIGVVMLFWSAVKVLSNIEASFNHIWDVRSRPLVRKLSDYLTIMLIGPLMMILSGSTTVFITHQVSAMSGRYELLQMVGPALYIVLKLLPFALIWILFTLVYMIMPNTRVKFDSALLAGIIAGTTYQAVQAAYILFQISAAKYNAIYGSFAALPLFLMWLQISWLIVIVGAEISYAYQHSSHMDQTDGGREMSIAESRLASLAVCRHVILLFRRGLPAQTTPQIADALRLPEPLVDNLIFRLIEANVLVHIEGDADEPPAVQPAQDIQRLTVGFVVSALSDVGADNGPLLAQIPEAGRISQILVTFREEMDRSSNNQPIMDI